MAEYASGPGRVPVSESPVMDYTVCVGASEDADPCSAVELAVDYC